MMISAWGAASAQSPTSEAASARTPRFPDDIGVPMRAMRETEDEGIEH
jgi:hypothetical protein